MADLDNKMEDANHIEAPEKPTKILIENAAIGSQIEHELSPWEAIKAYPVAVFWCLMVSMCVVMVNTFLRGTPGVVKTILNSFRRAMISFLLGTFLLIQHLRKNMASSYRPPTTTS